MGALSVASTLPSLAEEEERRRRGGGGEEETAYGCRRRGEEEEEEEGGFLSQSPPFPCCLAPLPCLLFFFFFFFFFSPCCDMSCLSLSALHLVCGSSVLFLFLTVPGWHTHVPLLSLSCTCTIFVPLFQSASHLSPHLTSLSHRLLPTFVSSCQLMSYLFARPKTAYTPSPIFLSLLHLCIFFFFTPVPFLPLCTLCWYASVVVLPFHYTPIHTTTCL